MHLDLISNAALASDKVAYTYLGVLDLPSRRERVFFALRSGVLPLCRFVLVVDEVDPAVGVDALFPSFGKRAKWVVFLDLYRSVVEEPLLALLHGLSLGCLFG